MDWEKSLIHPTARLIIGLAGEAESDHTLAPHAAGLQSRLCAESLRNFFNDNMVLVCQNETGCGRYPLTDFVADANLVACWVNLGYVEEAAIRNHILQSLISHGVLYDHQAYALVILFKLAGATFTAYADPSVVDRCFDLLRVYSKKNTTHRTSIQVSSLYEEHDMVLRQDPRKQLSYGSVGGRASLPHLYSQLGSRDRLIRTRTTPLQLPLPHPWEFQTKTSNLGFHSLHSNSPPPRRRTGFLDRPSLSLHPLASPLCPTSQSKIQLMKSLSSTPRS